MRRRGNVGPATATQNAVLDVIRRHLCNRGFPPSIREIGDELGMSSSSTVHAHLYNLEAKGYIKREKHSPRGIKLTTPFTTREERLEAILRRAVEETRSGVLDWLADVDAALGVTP